MQDVLLKYANEHFELLDNDEARTFLIAEGIFGNFSQGAFIGSRLQFLIYKIHPSHWILALWFQGHKIEADNGYAVYCFPKIEVPLKNVEDFCKEIQKCAKTADGEIALINLDENRN